MISNTQRLVDHSKLFDITEKQSPTISRKIKDYIGCNTGTMMMETIKLIIETFAIILAPITAVWVGQKLHDKELRRNDKLAIFKTLMATRNSWNLDSVRSLNIIEIVFSDNENVIKCWKEYYDKLCIQNPNETDYKKIKDAQESLLEAMANSLGYKDKVTLKTIQNPYFPLGMQQDTEMEREFKLCQLALIRQQIQSGNNTNNTNKANTQAPK